MAKVNQNELSVLASTVGALAGVLVSKIEGISEMGKKISSQTEGGVFDSFKDVHKNFEALAPSIKSQLTSIIGVAEAKRDKTKATINNDEIKDIVAKQVSAGASAADLIESVKLKVK